MNRSEKLNSIKSMLYCLQLIVTNDSIAYKFSNYLIIDDFASQLFNQLFNLKYEVSNYLENDKYPFELIEHNEKRITQILLASDDESILEVFDSFELLLENEPDFTGYSLYIFLIGIDSIHSNVQLRNSLREYQFDYSLYGLDDVVTKLLEIRDSTVIDHYIDFIQNGSDKLGQLLNVENELIDKLMDLLSNQHNYVSSSPTIFPQTSREYYENTSQAFSLNLEASVYNDIIVVLNGYSRHDLGARYCLGAVYSYIRSIWLKEDLEVDIIPHKALDKLSMVIFNDVKGHFKEEDHLQVNRLIVAIVTEALLRLKVDFNLYE